MSNSTIREMKKLASRGYMLDADFNAHVKELAGSNDRVAAIVGGTVIESGVEAVLRRFMRPMTSDLEMSLFGSNGPLATFSSKTHLAYAMGLLNQDQYRHINYIREIRNAFAHSITPLRFKAPEVAAVCALLKLKSPRAPARQWKHPRKQFFAMVLEVGKELANMRPPQAGSLSDPKEEAPH